MMRVERFDRERDLETINQWSTAYGMPRFPDYWLPPVGWIVPGVIAAFLYETNSGVAFVECIVGNPERTHEQRQQGLDLMDEAWTQYAQDNNIRALQGQTRFATIAEASRRNGWIASPPNHHVLLKVIGARS